LRFLIARLSSLGDVVCTLPAAVALKASFPGCEVVWCVDARFAGIVELCDAVDRVVVWPRSTTERKVLLKGVGEFDFAFDLQGLLKSALIVGGVKAKQKFGYHWQREGAWLFSQRVLPDPTSLHVSDQYLDVVRAAGASGERAVFGLVPDPKDVAKVRAMLPLGRDLVVCNAGAGWTTKRWPASHFARLADILYTEGFRVAFLGAGGDREAFEEVQAHGAHNAIDLVGSTNVRELVALVSIASVHVGGDTGSTHIAAALGVPAIGLYSVTRPDRSCPYGQRHNTLYDPRGLGNIAPEQVVATLKAAIGHNE